MWKGLAGSYVLAGCNKAEVQFQGHLSYPHGCSEHDPLLTICCSASEQLISR